MFAELIGDRQQLEGMYKETICQPKIFNPQVVSGASHKEFHSN